MKRRCILHKNVNCYKGLRDEQSENLRIIQLLPSPCLIPLLISRIKVEIPFTMESVYWLWAYERRNSAETVENTSWSGSDHSVDIYVG